jgi:soluble lytic murein transglycosylase
MTQRHSARTTLARWFSCAAALPGFVLLATLSGQTLDTLTRAHREKPSPETLAELLRFAAAHPSDQDGALALLLAGFFESGDRQYEPAIAHLEAARKRLPKLADYASFWLASARVEAKQFDDAVRDAAGVSRYSPSSPLAPRAVLIAGRALLEKGDPSEALRLLTAEGAKLQQPGGDMLLAKAHEAAGNLPAAAAAYQRVFYRDLFSPEAAEAEQELQRLKTTLADNYPPAMPQAMLTRAARLLDAGDYARARQEFEALIPQLGGSERELAYVRAGVARYMGRETNAAFDYLAGLQISSPEADSERLHYLLGCARRLDRREEVNRILETLGAKYPKSPWRLQALVSAANQYLLDNDSQKYEPLYRACYESFTGETRGGYCHWKVTWSAYLRRAPEAAEMFRTHLLTFPGSEKASAALYYLGRISEEQRDPASAKTYYLELQKRFTNSFYARVPGRASLEKAAMKSVQPSAAVAQFLGTVKFPVRTQASFEAGGSTRERIERAKLLVMAGMDEWAEGELRHGSRTEGQAHVLAYEMAKIASQRGSPFQALRYIKSFAPGYLYLPADSAPAGFWRLAFPLPYRETLEKRSREQRLDPFLIAALIRQESEFDPAAVSRANARGLMQVMPATGAQIAKRIGIPRFRRDMLFDPDISIRLGTYHFRQVLDQFGGNLEQALAAYNSGKSRVDRWLTWASYQEPSEFIETIPFTETRDYVQIVLRNAALYRSLYGPGTAAVSSEGESVRKNSGSAAKPARSNKAKVSKRSNSRLHRKRNP